MKPNKKTPQGKRTAPVYEKLLNSLLDEVARAEPGDRLPTDRELADRWSVNHQTVRRAMDQLVRFRMVERRVGAGTFLVRKPTESLRDGIRNSPPPRGGISRDIKRQVGFLMVQDGDGVAVQLFEHVVRETIARGQQCMLKTLSSLAQGGMEAALQMADEGCYAVILCWSMDAAPSTSDLSEFLEVCPLPVVLGDLVEGFEPWCYETAGAYGQPDEKAMTMAHRYFLELEYERIAFLIPNHAANEALARRLMVYNRLMWEQGRDPLVAMVGPGAPEMDAVVERWTEHRGDLAVICFDDARAVRLLMALHKRQWRLPEDIGVLGFNNISLGKELDPPLSTIQFDYAYVAKAMLNHALALSRGTSAQSRGGARENLVIRKSCGGVLRKADELPDILARAEEVWAETSAEPKPEAVTAEP